METVRISTAARDQLLTLKRRTGIKNWNTLCRWAFCLSLREKSVPPVVKLKLDSNVEMSWKTFAGEADSIYWDLLQIRLVADGVNPTTENLELYFKLHLHRGIGYLVGDERTKSIEGLLSLAD